MGHEVRCLGEEVTQWSSGVPQKLKPFVYESMNFFCVMQSPFRGGLRFPVFRGAGSAPLNTPMI